MLKFILVLLFLPLSVWGQTPPTIRNGCMGSNDICIGTGSTLYRTAIRIYSSDQTIPPSQVLSAQDAMDNMRRSWSSSLTDLGYYAQSNGITNQVQQVYNQCQISSVQNNTMNWDSFLNCVNSSSLNREAKSKMGFAVVAQRSLFSLAQNCENPNFTGFLNRNCPSVFNISRNCNSQSTSAARIYCHVAQQTGPSFRTGVQRSQCGAENFYTSCGQQRQANAREAAENTLAQSCNRPEREQVVNCQSWVESMLASTRGGERNFIGVNRQCVAQEFCKKHVNEVIAASRTGVINTVAVGVRANLQSFSERYNDLRKKYLEHAIKQYYAVKALTPDNCSRGSTMRVAPESNLIPRSCFGGLNARAIGQRVANDRVFTAGISDICQRSSHHGEGSIARNLETQASDLYKIRCALNYLKSISDDNNSMLNTLQNNPLATASPLSAVVNVTGAIGEAGIDATARTFSRWDCGEDRGRAFYNTMMSRQGFANREDRTDEQEQRLSSSMACYENMIDPSLQHLDESDLRTVAGLTRNSGNMLHGLSALVDERQNILDGLKESIEAACTDPAEGGLDMAQLERFVGDGNNPFGIDSSLANELWDEVNSCTNGQRDNDQFNHSTGLALGCGALALGTGVAAVASGGAAVAPGALLIGAICTGVDGYLLADSMARRDVLVGAQTTQQSALTESALNRCERLTTTMQDVDAVQTEVTMNAVGFAMSIVGVGADLHALRLPTYARMHALAAADGVISDAERLNIRGALLDDLDNLTDGERVAAQVTVPRELQVVPPNYASYISPEEFNALSDVEKARIHQMFDELDNMSPADRDRIMSELFSCRRS